MSRITKKYIHLSCAHISYLNSQIKTVYIWKTRFYFGGVSVTHLFFTILCCPIMCLDVLSFVL